MYFELDGERFCVSHERMAIYGRVSHPPAVSQQGAKKPKKTRSNRPRSLLYRTYFSGGVHLSLSLSLHVCKVHVCACLCRARSLSSLCGMLPRARELPDLAFCEFDSSSGETFVYQIGPISRQRLPATDPRAARWRATRPYARTANTHAFRTLEARSRAE